MNEASDALERFFQERPRCGVTHAHMAAAAVAEGRTWDYGDLLFIEEPLGELHIAEAGRAH
jgi:hypothetical protein